MKQITIRQEKKKDHQAVFSLIENAFEAEQYSDHQEQFLVERLRKSTAFVPELSLVAEEDNKIVGYILLTKIAIKGVSTMTKVLALAPVAVLPPYQGKGIGGQLIIEAHTIAQQLGFKAIVLLGHALYYPKFGYSKASKFDIQLPFDVPEENCMVLELEQGSLDHVAGMVVYPSEFFE